MSLPDFSLSRRQSRPPLGELGKRVEGFSLSCFSHYIACSRFLTPSRSLLPPLSLRPPCAPSLLWSPSSRSLSPSSPHLRVSLFELIEGRRVRSLTPPPLLRLLQLLKPSRSPTRTPSSQPRPPPPTSPPPSPSKLSLVDTLARVPHLVFTVVPPSPSPSVPSRTTRSRKLPSS